MKATAGLIVLALGCGGGRGGDGDGGPVGFCGVNGSGTVNGTVDGVSISPVMRANVITVPGEGVAIMLDEVGGACGVPAGSGEHLLLVFCSTPTEGTHTVTDQPGFICPGTNAASLIEQNGASDFAESLSGSITIDDASSGCVSGSFSVTLQGPNAAGTMTGAFDAVVCPPPPIPGAR